VFNYQEGPNYRDLFPRTAAARGMVPSCAEGGVVGVRFLARHHRHIQADGKR